LTVVGAIGIPLRGRLKEARFRKVLLHYFLVEGDAKAGFIGKERCPPGFFNCFIMARPLYAATAARIMAQV
jgi:hypothetical protein